MTYWIKCNSCGYETHPDFADCTCEECEACDWSDPYPETRGRKPLDDKEGS